MIPNIKKIIERAIDVAWPRTGEALADSVSRAVQPSLNILSKGFLTSTSGDGRPYITIQYRTMEELHEAHNVLIALQRLGAVEQRQTVVPHLAADGSVIRCE